MKLFIKRNHSRFKDALIKEADGLDALAHALQVDEKLHVPKVYSVDAKELHVEMIDATRATKEQFALLGRSLAEMHKKEYEFYGYTTDNYIGLNPQKNSWSKNWGAFFIEYRLSYQLSLMRNSSIKEKFTNILNRHQNRLKDFLNEYTKHPSIVHGDLWSGNVLFDTEHIWLIDPALYYGDREVDIAMSEMFGGFDSSFYESYEKEYPKSSLYQTKKIIYNLYHYLNHYNLFGSGYLGGCEEGFRVIERV